MCVAKYRKKPVVIEACQFNGVNIQEIQEFGQGKVKCDILDTAWEVSLRAPSVLVTIDTLEGTMTADKGDYIIKGVNGEFYPCKPDIFAKTYEEVIEDEEI